MTSIFGILNFPPKISKKWDNRKIPEIQLYSNRFWHLHPPGFHSNTTYRLQRLAKSVPVLPSSSQRTRQSQEKCITQQKLNLQPCQSHFFNFWQLFRYSPSSQIVKYRTERPSSSASACSRSPTRTASTSATCAAWSPSPTCGTTPSSARAARTRRKSRRSSCPTRPSSSSRSWWPWTSRRGWWWHERNHMIVKYFSVHSFTRTLYQLIKESKLYHLWKSIYFRASSSPSRIPSHVTFHISKLAE